MDVRIALRDLGPWPGTSPGRSVGVNPERSGRSAWACLVSGSKGDPMGRQASFDDAGEPAQ